MRGHDAMQAFHIFPEAPCLTTHTGTGLRSFLQLVGDADFILEYVATYIQCK